MPLVLWLPIGMWACPQSCQKALCSRTMFASPPKVHSDPRSDSGQAPSRVPVNENVPMYASGWYDHGSVVDVVDSVVGGGSSVVVVVSSSPPGVVVEVEVEVDVEVVVVV